MDNKALGKGLSALIPQKQEGAQGQEQHELMTMKTAKIKNNSLQPRTHYDDIKLDELKDSIKEIKKALTSLC